MKLFVHRISIRSDHARYIFRFLWFFFFSNCELRVDVETWRVKGERSIDASLGENRLQIARGIRDERNDDSSRTFRTSFLVLPVGYRWLSPVRIATKFCEMDAGGVLPSASIQVVSHDVQLSLFRRYVFAVEEFTVKGYLSMNPGKGRAK